MMPPVAHPWWEDRRFLLAIALLMAAPLIWPAVPPLVDLPGHMGRYRVQLDLGQATPLQGFYGFEWQLTGNLGVDLLVIPLAPLLGLELAVKLIVMAIPVLTATGLLWIAREVHGRVPPTAFFALPLAYGYPFQFGFVNFALAMALALNAFALWLRLGRQGRERLRAALFVPVGLLLWLCHIYGWASLCVMVFAAETVRRGALLAAIPACLTLAPPAALMLLWRSGSGSGVTEGWFNLAQKLRWIVTVLQDRWQWLDLGALGLLLGVLVWARRHPVFGFARLPLMVTLGLLLAFLLLPRTLFGSAYADMRLAPYVLALALLAIAPRGTSAFRAALPVLLIALAFLGVRLAATTASYAAHDARARAALGALDHVPEGARIAAFVGKPCLADWSGERLDHIPSMAIVRRHAFTNDQWAIVGAQLLTIRKADAPPLSADPSQFVQSARCPQPVYPALDRVLPMVPHRAFDYVWLLDPPELPNHSMTKMRQLWTNGRDSLYRLEGDAGASGAQRKVKP